MLHEKAAERFAVRVNRFPVDMDTEIKDIFELRQLAEYLDTPRRLGPLAQAFHRRGIRLQWYHSHRGQPNH
jgi:hypothetical protein